MIEERDMRNRRNVKYSLKVNDRVHFNMTRAL